MQMMLKFIVLVVLLNANYELGLAEESPDGEELLVKVIDRYKTASSYSDQGNAFSFWTNDSKKENIYLRPFKTSYSSPNIFRLEWQGRRHIGDSVENVVWGDNDGIFIKLGESPARRYTSINKVLSAAHGISGGVAYQILPWMLVGLDSDDYSGNLEITGNDSIQGKEAYIVSRTFDGELFERIWIEKSALILRKIERVRNIDNMNVTEVIEYEHVKLE